MKIEINEKTVEAIEEVMKQHDKEPKNLRVYLSGNG